MLAVARNGVIAFRNLYRISITQGFLPGGFRLGLDTTVADVWTRVPDPDVAGGWRAARAVLTIVVDVGSRMLVTFNLSLRPIDSGIMRGVLLRAIRQEHNYPGLLSTGVPHEVQVDRGAEHQGLFRETLKRLGIERRVTGDSNPQGNGRVERLIDTINKEVFSSLPGYSPTQRPIDPYAPPENDAKRNLRDLKYEPYRLELPVMALLTLPELEVRILGWATVYNQRPHRSLPANSEPLRQMIAQARQLDHTLTEQE